MNPAGLRPLLALATAAAALVGTVVPANMVRYIYSIKTNNQVVGLNQLEIGYSTAVLMPAYVGLDFIGHATQYEVWSNPDSLTEKSAPIYKIPAGNQIYLDTDVGNCYVLFAYEDVDLA